MRGVIPSTHQFRTNLLLIFIAQDRDSPTPLFIAQLRSSVSFSAIRLGFRYQDLVNSTGICTGIVRVLYGFAMLQTISLDWFGI